MNILVVIGLSAVLFLALELRLARRTRLDAEGTPVEWTLFSQAFIRRRLAALAEELEQLDRDPEAFAKAFHTMAARTAYEALLADASRLTEQTPSHVDTVLTAEFLGAAGGSQEVIEL